MSIVYGCCVGDWGKFTTNVVARIRGREVIALGGQNHIAVAYNAILRAARSMIRPGDALVLLHDDLEITDGQGETVILEAVERFDVSGPIGCLNEPDGILWWEAGLVGRQVTDSRVVGTAPFLGPAWGVDGSCMILSDAAVRGLHFDESYAGFHGYDADLCRAAHRWSWSADTVGVVPLETHHHTTLGFKSPEIEASWQEADRVYRAKWEVTR